MQSNANAGCQRYDWRMEFDPRRLEVLCAVAEHRSFTAAADALVTTQPAVSRQIARLEQELGVQLVIRGPRRVTLTRAGEALVAQAQTVLPAIDAAAREMRAYAAADGGAVRFGAVPSAMTALVPPALVALRERRPRVVVRADEGWSDDLIERVARGDLDLAVVSVPAGAVSPESTLLSADSFVALLPATHHLASQSELALADLRDEPWIVAPPPGVRRELLRVSARAGFVPEIVATASWEATVELVAVGLGVALVPESALAGKQGVAIRPVRDVPQRNLVIAYATRPRRTAVERDLASALGAAAQAMGHRRRP